MKMRWTILLATLTLFALALGCSDDKKAPPTDKEKKADQPVEAGKEPAASPKKKGAAPATEKPVSGEESASPEAASADGTKGGTEASPDKPIVPPKQIERALGKTALHGGIAPLDALVGKIGSVLSPGLKALMETAVYQGLLGEIAGEMKMKDMDWFDRTRSVRIAVRSKDSVVLIVPVVSREALTAALPEKVRADTEGKPQLRFKLGHTYAELIAKDLLLSDQQENIDLLDGTLKLELAKLKVDQLFSVILEGATLHPLISVGLDEMERGMEQVAPMDPTQKEFFAKLFSLAKDIVAEVDRIEVGLDIEAQELVCTYSVSAVAGTNLQAAISGASNLSISTLKYMPAKSWLIGGQNINPAIMMPWLERYMDILASAYSMSTDEKIELWRDYKVMIELMTGDGAFAVYNDAGYPLSMSAVSEVTDGPKMAALVYGIYEYFFLKAMDTLPPESRQMFSGRTLRDLIAQIQPMVKSFGVNLEIDSEDYQGIQMDYLRISLDYSLMSLPPDAAWVKDVIKDKLDIVMAFGPKHLIFTMGPNGLVRAKEIVDGKLQMDPAALFPGVDDNKYNFVMNIDPLTLMKSLEVIPQLRTFVRSEIGKELEMVAGHKGIFVYSGVEDAKAWAEVRIGLEKLMPLVEYTVKKEMEPAEDVGATEVGK